MIRNERILIIDFGSQVTQLIARRIRECGVFAEIVPCTAATLDALLEARPRGIILSGGPASVYAPDAPRLEFDVRTLAEHHAVPVLGICYGLQLLAYQAGGSVTPAERREYGRAELFIERTDPLFEGVPSPTVVWMSHGDAISQLPQALAWQHIAGKSEPETPPFILITTTTLLGLIPAFIAAVVLLVLFFIEHLSGIKQDALLMKNLTFYFGHTLVNEMLYFGVATLYELFPRLAGKPPYKTKPYVAIAWNLVLLVVWTAYFHHLYMDFVQPTAVQYIGQIASWIAPIPAVAVTTFTVLATVFRSGMQWGLASAFFFFGVMFWIIGGAGAILDAIVANNFVLHNTLWVPAHFHTYNLLGNVFFSLGFISWFVRETSGEEGSRLYRPVMALYLLGGTVFVLAFYLAGASSVMRRVDKYPELVAQGSTLALVGGLGALLVLIAVLMYVVHVVRRCVRVLAS